MMGNGKNILVRFKKRWQLFLYLEILLYATGAAILLLAFFSDPLFVLGGFLLVGGIMIFLKSPWKLSWDKVIRYIDTNLKTAEYSSGLLLLPAEEMSGLAQLQQEKIGQQLGDQLPLLGPDHQLGRAAVIFLGLVLAGLLGYHFGVSDIFRSPNKTVERSDTIIFRPIDSVARPTVAPRPVQQQLVVHYPTYTGLPALKTSKMDIRAVAGSTLSWSLKFNTRLTSVNMESMGQRFPMALKENVYTLTSDLQVSGFYNFLFTDTLNNSYVSPLYSLEVVADREPDIRLQGMEQFTTFDWDDEKGIRLEAHITDDFGVGDAYIIATVSKGSGESVKFREERLLFENAVQKGGKQLELVKKMDLDKMGMGPGDELYFYVEAKDLKRPMANIARSETYFAVIRDTVSDEFSVEGSMGVDQMPEYFRSQRQLILDTEKLIAEKGKLSQKEFNFRSNELGFDQKALRIKYGEFMGDESEMEGQAPEHQEGEETEEHGADPLAPYTHDHDGANEHNLVGPEKEADSEEEGHDPLHAYLHNHDDPEESTLFTQSLKSKLRQALNEMWESELHLRVYHPEKSLPYQYRALNLIQDIKNSARIYVHRIGFDPPPIKEDKRLTGKLEEVANFKKNGHPELPEQYPFIRKALVRLEELIREETPMTKGDGELFRQAGNELASKAIAEPGKYLRTLQQLNTLRGQGQISRPTLREVQRGLYRAISFPRPEPSANTIFSSDINALLLKELEVYGH